LEKRSLRGDLISVYKHLIGGNEEGARLLSDSVVSSDRERSNEYN